MTVHPFIKLVPVLPKGGRTVTLDLADGFAQPTIDGGWQTLTRVRRSGVTDFSGAAPLTQTIPVQLDGQRYQPPRSIETMMSLLYNMMRYPVGADRQPTVFTIRGVPIPFYNHNWVLTDISPSSEIRRSSDGHRTQFVGTITILEYIPAVSVIHTSAAKRAKAKSRGHGSSKASGTHHTKVKIYTVKRGDTLERIASREYGKSSEWHLIAKANNLRDPNRIQIGQKLKIPKD